MNYSVIIPIWNEEAIVPELVRRLGEVLNGLGGDAEVIFVDDGSSDRTGELIRASHAADKRIKLVSLSRNFGHQAAITAGLDNAAGKAVILMDGDLQDPPELIPELVAKWKEGFEVVYTVKRSRKEGALKRFAFASFYKLLHAFSSVSIPMEAGHFSLMDRRVADVLRGLHERNRYISGMRAWAGFRQTGVEFDRAARFAGEPKMTFRRLTNMALDGLISFSHAPLRLAIYLGILVAMSSFLLAFYVIWEKLFTDKAILGWASTIVAITFIGGMVLLTLGVIGEYVGRIYDEVKQRPIYVIREKTGL